MSSLSQPTSEVARKTFEIENEIVSDDSIYSYDANAQRAILQQRPWTADPDYFTGVRISAIALLKMAMHARSGKHLEVMGVMTGKVIGREFIVMDAYPLPVEGTETRVNALGEAYEYMVEYLSSLQDVGRPENIVGWYHSHPGYGCWLSGIDVGTQSQNQQFQDPFLAIVVDPNRTISAGKVDIGAFRTYPPTHNASGAKGKKRGKGGGSQEIPLAKLEDFGVHAAKYYPLSISYFKSSMDSQVLEMLWSKYWTSTLAQSSLRINYDYTNDQIDDLAVKTDKLVRHSASSENNEAHHSSIFADQLQRLHKQLKAGQQSAWPAIPVASKVPTTNDEPSAIDGVTANAVKIGSEELTGLISLEIKHSILQTSK
ncbi:Rri1p [Sugiyamaella lignohabitans]|uniref:COP9 signalosome complex subunit 5 n=1 Tax=Sugiyamaella lignohabitans TaxID=796027 RepID=A0A167CEH4_9ASCO|nr:Rri1p [Sugiyamaella lignohabitans]ANB11586.1 Rri1p [Sugiyamaella lignohabitans]